MKLTALIIENAAPRDEGQIQHVTVRFREDKNRQKHFVFFPYFDCYHKGFRNFDDWKLKIKLQSEINIVDGKEIFKTKLICVDAVFLDGIRNSKWC